MRLNSANGSAIELAITGYQFPDGRELRGRTVFSDWLNVVGKVRANALEWNFSCPCLYADEAVQLGEWVTTVSRGDAVTTHLHFTEPNLSIWLVGSDEASAVLRFRFRQESSPPGQSDEVRLRIGYPVTMAVDLHQLARAGDEWNRELESFPAR